MANHDLEAAQAWLVLRDGLRAAGTLADSVQAIAALEACFPTLTLSGTLIFVFISPTSAW